MQTHSETPARLLRIRGLVQGVGYRNALLREATRLGLSGWVRNRRRGPPAARVSEVSWEATQAPVEAGFYREETL